MNDIQSSCVFERRNNNFSENRMNFDPKKLSPEERRLDVIVKFFHPVVAGIETNILNIYSYLAKEGWEVIIHTSTSTPDAPHSLPDRGEIRGLSIRRYPWRWYGFVPDIDWKRKGSICLHNFNVFPHSWMLFLVLILRIFHRTNRMVFLVPHGGYTPGWWTFTPFQRFSKRIYQRLIGTLLINRVVDGLRSVSEWESAETIKSGVRRDIVETIPNGIEREVSSDIEGMASEKIRGIVKELGDYVVQVGRIHPIKNQLTTIRAVAKVPGVTFAIAGPVTDEKYKLLLDEEIQKLDVSDRVRFLGVVDGIDKYYLLRHSLANTHMASWESYCNAVHESMSQGCVCIVAKDTALEELIKDGVNGYAVSVEDASAVAEKIRYVLKQKGSNDILEMRKRNIAFTEGHSWDDLAKKVESFYTKTLARKHS